MPSASPTKFWIRSRRVFWAALLLVTLASCSTSSRAKARGRTDAQADISAGKLAIESFGLPSPDAPVYRRLLKERYGIELRPVAGCVVDEQILGHAAGYNEVMNAEITRRHGPGLFDKVSEESRQEFQKTEGRQGYSR